MLNNTYIFVYLCRYVVREHKTHQSPSKNSINLVKSIKTINPLTPRHYE